MELVQPFIELFKLAILRCSRLYCNRHLIVDNTTAKSPKMLNRKSVGANSRHQTESHWKLFCLQNLYSLLVIEGCSLRSLFAVNGLLEVVDDVRWPQVSKICRKTKTKQSQVSNNNQSAQNILVDFFTGLALGFWEFHS